MKKIFSLAVVVAMTVMSAMAALTPGQKAPDFTLPDTEGKQVTLSSLRGQWVVLDFWGSWCGWCIKGFPQMKQWIADNPGKVTFVGVDCGDTEQAWKNAIAKHGLTWLNLRQPKEAGEQTTQLYQIQGFPTKLIVNPDGYVVNITVGEDPEFYNILSALVD